MKTLLIQKAVCHYLWLLLFLLITAINAQAAWQNIGNVARVAAKTQNQFVLQTSSGALVAITFQANGAIRVRIAPTGKFESDQSYSLTSFKLQTTPIKFSENPDQIELFNQSSGEKVVISKKPFAITIFDSSGEKVLTDSSTVFDLQSGAIQTTKMRRGSRETYYGFGSKALPLSRDAQTMTMWNTDTYRFTWGSDPIYQSIPFFIALERGKAYGLFFHNTFRTTFDMGKSAPDQYSFGATGGELDYFVFTGGRERSPAQILTDYSELTGRTPLPPIWALGNQQSRYSYVPQARVLEVAREFRRRKIPADVIYIDIDHMDGYRVFTWDKAKFPDPKQLLDELAKIDFRAVIIVDPAVKVDDNYAVYRDGKAKNVFVKNSDGSEYQGFVWAGNSAFPDFTNPVTRQWFGALYQTYLETGIAGFWNDMNEPSVFPQGANAQPPTMYNEFKTIPLDARSDGDAAKDGGTHKRFHNVYGLQMVRSTFEGVQKLQPEKRPFILTRAGFAGVQRFAAVWTGDNTASWEHLQLSLPMLLNLSVSGVPFVGADVGGYSDTPSGELYARWLQAAALWPFLRSHSENNLPNKEPWEYGADFESINRASIELRYQFLPYLYTVFRQHELTGQPVMRPLWFAYPKDVQTYLIDDEYLVGRDLLVAPVVKSGQRKRTVYFPAGDDWRDWWTGELYPGGTAVEVNAPLERLLLFARVGATIPAQPVVQSTAEMSKTNLTFHVIVGIATNKLETSTVFQDAGDGYDYRKKAWRETKIEHQKGLLKFSKTGEFAKSQQTKFVEILGIEIAPREIKVDGKSIDIKFEPDKRRVRFEITGETKEVALIP